MSKKKKQKNSPKATSTKAAFQAPKKEDASIVKEWLDAKTEQDRGDYSMPEKRQSGRYKGFSLLPTCLKTFLIKGWFAAAVYFFIGFGLFFDRYDTWDILVGMGLLIGLITNLMINRFLITVDGPKNNINRFITTTNRRWPFVFVDLVYAAAVVIMISFVYSLFNLALINLNNLPENSVPFPAEPIGFGILYFLIDLALLQLRNLIVFIYNKIKREEEVV